MGHGCHDCGSPNSCECPEVVVQRELGYKERKIKESLSRAFALPKNDAGNGVGKATETDPTHYARLSPEPIEVIEKWGLGFRLGNAIKYLARAGHKPGASRASDLRKALWYINRELEHAD